MILNYNIQIQDERIKRKTHNLTRDSARNDPIGRQIKGFSFCDFKDDRQHLRGKFSLFFRKNLTFNHSLDVEMSLEKENKRFKDWDV